MFRDVQVTYARSAEQLLCCGNESAGSDDAPCEISVEHVRCDVLTVVGGLSTGNRNGVGLFRHELGVGPCASDGVSIEY